MEARHTKRKKMGRKVKILKIAIISQWTLTILTVKIMKIRKRIMAAKNR